MRTEFKINNKIYATIWETENPKGIVQLVHGIGDYILRYDELANYLCQRGYIVCGSDHEGQGQSKNPEERYGMSSEHWSDTVENVYSLSKIVKEKYPGLPFILFGHSMGSFVVRAYSTKYGEEIDAIILLGTGQIDSLTLGSGLAVCETMRTFSGNNYKSKFMRFICTGKYNAHFTKKDGADYKVNWLSRDFDEVKKYISDRACTFTPSLAMYSMLIKMTMYVSKKQNIEKIPKIPVLIMSGEEDPLGNFGKGVLKFYSYIKEANKNVTLKLYEGARHELFKELNKEQVFEDIFQWIEKVAEKNKLL